MQELSDDILRAAAGGDMEAFEQVYRAYSAFVYNVAYRMVAVKEDAEEVTQEVFLTVHRKLNSFLFRSSLKTWVYRITVNCAINCLNKRNRMDKGRVEMEDVMPSLAAPGTPRQDLESVEFEQKLWGLLNVLNPDERACVVLRSMESLSYEDIARSLRVNLNTVRTRLKRAREKMVKVAREVGVNE